MRSCLMGIDAGTTNIKVVVFDPAGSVLAQASRPTVAAADGAGTVHPPEEIWGAVTALIREAVDAMPAGTRVEGLAITGMGECGTLVDEEGGALYPLIAWFDRRMIPMLDWWRESFPVERLVEITGLRPQYILAANKLLWLKANEPELFARAHKWLCIEGFLAMRLTGACAMDYSVGCRTMLMDLAKRDWSAELLAHAGIPERLMPPLVAPGTKIGAVHGAASAATGLPEGTPVFAGGHDHVCGAFACGIVEPGQVMDSSGTAEVVFTPAPDMGTLREQGGRGFNTGTHVAADRLYLSGGMTASGASMDWYHRMTGLPSGEHPDKLAGAKGLLFLPHLRGSSSPQRDALSRGSFLGITDQHGPYDFSQAVCEGLCMEFRLMMERLLGVQRPARIVAIGGGTRNLHWIQTKANVLQQPIETCSLSEATALGAAMLAGLGAGVYRDERDAHAQAGQPTATVRHDPALAELYHKRFAVYRQMYETLLPLHRALAE